MHDPDHNPAERWDAAASTPGIREEGETEGDGVERETLDAADETRIERHYDPTRIRIATREPAVDIVMERIRRGEIDLAPDFQRSGDIWTPGTQSRLIESILLRIPLPVFYMAANPDDKWQVIDGLQRLGTLRNFILDKRLRLSGLEYLNQFDGHGYNQLPRHMQRRITETQLSCHVIEPGTPPEVMFNIFKRIIDSVGKPLVGQEIRHALNPGPARDLLSELAGSAEFRRVPQRHRRNRQPQANGGPRVCPPVPRLSVAGRRLLRRQARRLPDER